MKKIFIVTGEPSGDKLASEVVKKLKEKYEQIEYRCVGGEHLNSLGIKSIFDLKDITHLAFTSVLMNIFKINKRINQTVNSILEFKPDILLSVDSPDFTLRVSERVKKKNSDIKTIHYVAPQVWVWREGRLKKFKKFLDHVLLLFKFEQKYFDKENISNTFVGHPLLEKKVSSKINLDNYFDNSKKIVSIFPGSRKSEIDILLPILLKSVVLINNKLKNLNFVFHATNETKDFIEKHLKETNIDNIDTISDPEIKFSTLAKSIFAISKSGTVSLEICNQNIPSIIIYKLNFINYFIIKSLVKIRFANIINIINDEEIIPELIQNECNPKEISNSVIYLLKNPKMVELMLNKIQKTLSNIKSQSSSTEEAAKVIMQNLS